MWPDLTFATVTKIVIVKTQLPLIAIVQISSDSTRAATGPLEVFIKVSAFSDSTAYP